MVTRKFKKSFRTEAITLDPAFVSDRAAQPGEFSKTHPNMWTVSGRVIEDFYYWVNDFKATHLVYGTVEGNFETGITGPSDEVIDMFLKEFPPSRWDYYDI